MPASAFLLAARVASLNLCTDEYLLLLARPDEVASVSYLSQDPLESPLWRLGRRFHGNYGSFEQVLKTRPEVLLTMGGGGRASGLLAERIVIPLDAHRGWFKPTDDSLLAARRADLLLISFDSSRRMTSRTTCPVSQAPWGSRVVSLQST